MSPTDNTAEPGSDRSTSRAPGRVAGACRRLEDACAGTDPRRTAAALALGVFLSFSPFLGFQVLIGFSVAFALRLSRVAVLIGLCANLPWIMLPWYAVTTAAAATLVGTSADVDINGSLAELLQLPIYRPAFWDRAGDLVSAFFWPFVIGPSSGAAVLGALAYVAGVRFLSGRLERRRTSGVMTSARSPGDAEQRAADRHVHDAQGARLQP